MRDLSLPSTPVVVAGDWHSSFQFLPVAFGLISAAAPAIDSILHVGDFGLFPTARGSRFLETVDEHATGHGVARVVVTPGNHEDWDWLNSLLAAAPGCAVQVSETVWVLPRGFRFSIAGRAFLSFGGAASVDYARRIAGHDWFLSEIPTDDDVDATIAGGPVDVLITHDAIDGGTRATEFLLRSNLNGWSAEALHYSATSRERVTRLWEGVEPALLFHGHFHAPDSITVRANQSVVSLGREFQDRNLLLLDPTSLEWDWLSGTDQGTPVSRTRNIEKLYLARPGEA